MVNAPDFIGKDEWPPNSPDLNPLEYCVWGLMLESYKKISPKPTSLTELKVALQSIWDELSLTGNRKKCPMEKIPNGKNAHEGGKNAQY